MSNAALIVCAGIFAAGLLRGFTGFGLAIAAVPTLAMVMPPQQVVPVIIGLQLLAGLFDLPRLWRQADWRIVLPLAATMAVCTPLGTLLLRTMSADIARLCIGGLIFASVALLRRGLRLPAHPPAWVTVGVGAISGVMNGIAAMAGPPAIVYLLAMEQPVRVMRASSIAYFVLTAAAAAVPLSFQGLMGRETALWSLLAFPALMAGQWLGTRGFHRASGPTHRRVAMLTLTVLASLLTGRAALALLG